MNDQLGIEQSRRDDMESLGYVLMYFLRGKLPWEGIKSPNKRRNFESILKLKQSETPELLCQGYHPEFREYFNHCLSLGFEDEPDYK
jgi:serine/threonine protein kinase